MGVDIGFDVMNFDLSYQVNGKWTPTYHLVSEEAPPVLPNPFNTPEAPFLMPADVETFGGQLNVSSVLGNPPIYWQFIVKFIDHTTNQPIMSKGFMGQAQPFDFGVCTVGPVLGPNSSGQAGYTPMDSVGQFRDTLFQPEDFKLNQPIKMQLTLTAHSDYPPTPQNKLPDDNPSNNLIEVWIQRGG